MKDEERRLFTIIQKATGITIRRYDGLMKEESDDPEDLYPQIFTFNECRNKLYQACLKQKLPALVSDPLHLIWLGIPVYNGDDLREVYVLGPVFTSDITENVLRNYMNNFNLSIKTKVQFYEDFKKIPIIPYYEFIKYASMCYYSLFEMELKISDIYIACEVERQKPTELQKFVENETHGTYEQERKLMNAYRTGEAINVETQPIMSGKIGRLCPWDPLRQAKDEAIIGIALIARAAIDGGLHEEASLSLSDYYIQSVEWYAKGYIYKDFASRTTDVFYFPNPALTYGAAAGIWFGLGTQLGTAMSMPDKGLNVDVRALPSPIDTEHGVQSAPEYQTTAKNEFVGGAVITTKCKDVERLLASLDYFYSKEGSYIMGYGFDAKNAAADALYNKIDLKDGTYTMDENGAIKYNDALYKDPTLYKNFEALYGNRLPGVKANDYPLATNLDVMKEGWMAWTIYGNKGKLPLSLQRTDEEDTRYTKNQSNIDDYVNTMVLKFILGNIELNQTTWDQFKDQLAEYGVNDNIAITQAEYDRYQKR